MRPRKKNRHLPACVHPKHGAYYYVKGNAWTFLARDLAPALAEYARRFEPARERNALDELIEQTFARIMRRPAANGQHRSPSTVEQYTDCVRLIKEMLEAFGDPRQIKASDVFDVQGQYADRPFMANRIITVLRLIMDEWTREHRIDANPAIGVKRLPERKRKRVMSPAEFAAGYAKAPPRLRCMLDLWRLTGQRVMDVVNIRLADLRNDGIYFRQDKTDAELVIRWNPELRAAVERARTLYGNVRAMTLFHNRRGTAAPGYRTIHHQFRAAFRGIADDLQIRDLRATGITRMKQQAGRAAAQALAGHKSEAMTDRYIRDREVPIVDGPSFEEKIG